MQTTELDEAMIARQVHAFYEAARRDDVLGPIFEAQVTDWDSHLARICDFWSSVALRTRRYDGTPMPVHIRLPIDDAHFLRWLALWAETARAQCPPDVAERLITYAGRIGSSFAHGIAVYKGRLPPTTA